MVEKKKVTQRRAKAEPKEEETEQIKSRRRPENVRRVVVWRAFPRLARWLRCPSAEHDKDEGRTIL